ncbi:hypothetical protein ACFLYS_01740 [Chloroflexota bacterium]
MDFTDALKPFNHLNRLVIIREERIKREGSAPYVYTGGVIAAGAYAEFEVAKQFPESRKYAPLDYIQIINNEATNDITVAINGSKLTRYCPAKTIHTISNQALWTIRVTNNGAGNTTAGKVVLTLQKEAMTADKLAQRLR